VKTVTPFCCAHIVGFFIASELQPSRKLKIRPNFRPIYGHRVVEAKL